MSDVPRCTESQIRRCLGERSLRLGREYLADGAVSDTTLREGKIQAKVQGTASRPYRVWITFGPDGIAAANCSCPVGDGGRCKHAAAVLLAWLDDPDSFEPTERLERALEQRSKPELVALIRLMLKHEPDLESLVAMPLPGTSDQSAVKAETYRKQAVAALNRAGGEWGWHKDAAEQLEAIRELGDQFLKRGEAASATAVFAGVAEAVDEDVLSADEAGDLFGVVANCAAGLGQCLEIEKDSARRETVLEAMFNMYLLDIDMGGTDLAPTVPDDILKHAAPGERRLVAVWVRDRLPEADPNWAREVLGGFLLELEKDRLDDESYLRICKQSGRFIDLVERLLKLGRDEQATSAAREASDYELIEIADLMAAQGRALVAEMLISDRADHSADARLLEWLRKRARDAGDAEKDLKLSLAIYRKWPSLEEYMGLRALARRLGEWEQLRPKLLTGLKREGGDGAPPLLVEICLLEGDIDQALQLIKPRKAQAGSLGHSIWGRGSPVELKVAEAAEATRPEAAIEIYRRCAERQISLRHRGAYREACEWLAKVRSIHLRLKRQDEWARYLNGLREQHRALRALTQEMDAARL